MKLLNTTLLLAGALTLSACSGYQSLYTATADEISSVHVQSVKMILDANRGAGLRRPAQLINNELKKNFTAQDGAPYALTVRIEEDQENLTVRTDGIASRVRLTLKGFISVTKDGEEVLSTTAEARAPYSLETTPYSTESGIDNARKNAAKTLADEIMHRVTFFLYTDSK